MALVRSKIQKFSGGHAPRPPLPPFLKDIMVTCPTITDILATPLLQTLVTLKRLMEILPELEMFCRGLHVWFWVWFFIVVLMVIFYAAL